MPYLRLTLCPYTTLFRSRGQYEVIVRDEVGSIRNTASGEVMHSINNPAEEARSLYVEQSRLLERLQTAACEPLVVWEDRKSTRLNSSHVSISYAVFCLKK